MICICTVFHGCLGRMRRTGETQEDSASPPWHFATHTASAPPALSAAEVQADGFKCPATAWL